MAQITEAIFAEGVLRPIEQLYLTENQRVRLIVETVESGPLPNRASAVEQMIKGMRESKLRLEGPPPTRDELHERV
jgi:predicted DNA-binding antitoxin AbrB/MazE fold protein